MNQRRKRHVILMLSCLAGWILPSVAQDIGEDEGDAEAAPTYAVELIVFRRLDLSVTYPEDFSRQQAPRSESTALANDLPGNRAPAEGDDPPVPSILEFELIPNELLTLTSVFDRLSELDRYEPLLHVGWVQAGYEDDLALPFEIAVVSEDDMLLSGTVTLRRSRFLHLDVDLTLQQNADRSFHLHETRKIPPPYATHYFDHPALSVIARVNHFEAIEQPPLEPELPDNPSVTP